MTDLCKSELSHLLSILRSPYKEAWKGYVWKKAQELEKEPFYAGLCDAIVEAMKLDKEKDDERENGDLSI